VTGSSRLPPPWASYVPGGSVPRDLHLGARRRASPRRNRLAAARASVWAGIAMGLTEDAGLPLRHPARSAFRIILPPLTSEFMNIIKKLLGGADPSGCLELTGPSAIDARVQLQGGSRRLPRRPVIYLLTNLVVVLAMRARWRKKVRVSRTDRPQAKRAAGRGRALMSGFRFRRHPAILGLPLQGGK